MWRGSGLVALAACGRLGFAPARTTGDGGPTDDGALGDGASGDGGACTPFDLRLPRTSPAEPNIVWTGSKYLVTSAHNGMLAITAVAPDGSYTITDFAPAASTYLNGPQGGAVWTGDTLAVVWTINGELFIQFFDGDGVARGAAHPLAGPGTPAASLVVWTGDRYAVIDQTVAGALAFREVDTAGNPFAQAVQTGPNIPTSFVVTTGGYLISADTSPSTITRVDHAGAATGTHAIALDAPVNLAPAGSGFIATGSMANQAAFALLDATGATTSGPTLLPTGPNGDLHYAVSVSSATGVVVFGETVSGTSHDLMRMELDLQGNVIVAPVVIGSFPSGVFGDPGGIVAPGRAAETVTYLDLSTSAGVLAIIQSCD